MLHDVFFWMVNECIRLTVLALVMLPVRKILKKVSARLCYCFWSMIPLCILVGGYGLWRPGRDAEPAGLPKQSGLLLLPDKLLYLLEAVWLIGMAVKLYGAVLPYIKLKRYLVGSICIEENVYVSSRVMTPFSMGLFVPKIYLPAGLSEEYYPPIIMHEKVHVARKDLWANAFAVFFTVLFWFCPIWNKVCDICIKDMEAACDEAVVRKSSVEFKRLYAEALVMVSFQHGDIKGFSLGCGREAIEERIGHIMRYGKISMRRKRKALIAFISFGILFVTVIPLLPNVIGKAETVEIRTEQTGEWEIDIKVINLSNT